jgi:hypothetical protein
MEFCVLLTQFIHQFCMDLRIKSYFLPYTTPTVYGFITEAECVYYAVRAEPSCISLVNVNT